MEMSAASLWGEGRLMPGPSQSGGGTGKRHENI